YLRPASDYVVLGKPMTYWNVVEGARRRGEVAIGYRLAEGDGDGIRVNPPKDSSVTFGAEDRLIVVAEN
ncbi:MAG TPA: potassium transporter TrkA, partial [Thermoanaerobaculia bacterium]